MTLRACGDELRLKLAREGGLAAREDRQPRRTTPVGELTEQVRALLAQPLDDAALRERLEGLTAEQSFNGLTWLWGPVLYARNRTLFRPFILSHFATFVTTGRWKVEQVEWKKQVADALDPWLARVDADDDVDLFRRLYAWKLSGVSGLGIRGNLDKRDAHWRADLVARFAAAAATPTQRATVLAKFDGWYRLDEPSALALYRADPDAAKKFVLKHLPLGWWGMGDKRTLWADLFAEALRRRDEDLAFALYRKQVSLKQWEQDALSLCDRTADARALDAELERRHPEGWGLDLGGTVYKLVERRRRDVLPYVLRHLRDVYGHWHRSGYARLLDLAVREQWLDLWAAVVRTCSRPQDYNREVNRLLDDRGLDDPERQRRLVMLTGASREWNFPGFGLAQVHLLDERTALRLYDAYPHLVRGPFKLHVAPVWGEAYEGLIGRLIVAGDEPLIDFLASRIVTRPMWDRMPWTQKPKEAIERLADYYTNLRLDDAAFSRRAAAVLTQVPAYAIHSYNQLIRSNRLARLLFERSARSYLADPASVRDLVEGSEIHVQALAYRTLALDDGRAREQARSSLDILLGTFLRPLKRRTRALAFGALKNAASTPGSARVVLERARLALDLPDKKYPKEELVGLIGHVLWRYPELRQQPIEQPVVFEHAGRTPR